jgi:hypothetical protein
MSISLESSSFVINKSSSISLATSIKSHLIPLLPCRERVRLRLFRVRLKPAPRTHHTTQRHATPLLSLHAVSDFFRLSWIVNRREDSLKLQNRSLFLGQSGGGGGDSTCVDPNRHRNRNRNSLTWFTRYNNNYGVNWPRKSWKKRSIIKLRALQQQQERNLNSR